MCNLYRMEKAPDAIVGFARELGMELDFPEGVPNFEPRDVRITERAPIVRSAGAAPGGFELVDRRWSWPAPTDRPRLRRLPTRSAASLIGSAVS